MAFSESVERDLLLISFKNIHPKISDGRSAFSVCEFKS